MSDKTRRAKCYRCGSIHVVLLEDVSQPDDGAVRMDLNCGKCGHNIYEFGV